MSWSHASPTVITSRSRQPSPSAGPRSGTSTGCGRVVRPPLRMDDLLGRDRERRPAPRPPARSRPVVQVPDERHARAVRPQLQGSDERRHARRAEPPSPPPPTRRVRRETQDQDLRREVLRAALDRTQSRRERLVVAAGARSSPAAQAEVLVVERVRQLVGQDEALGQARGRCRRCRRADRSPGCRTRPPGRSGTSSSASRRLEPARDHADRPPRLGPTRVEVDRIVLVEVLRRRRSICSCVSAVDGHVRRVLAARGPLDLLLHRRDRRRASAPRASTPEPLPVFGTSQSAAMAAAAEPGPRGHRRRRSDRVESAGRAGDADRDRARDGRERETHDGQRPIAAGRSPSPRDEQPRPRATTIAAADSAVDTHSSRVDSSRPSPTRPTPRPPRPSARTPPRTARTTRAA